MKNLELFEGFIKKYGENLPIDALDKAKRVRFMQSKGFPSDIIFQLFK